MDTDKTDNLTTKNAENLTLHYYRGSMRPKGRAP